MRLYQIIGLVSECRLALVALSGLDISAKGDPRRAEKLTLSAVADLGVNMGCRALLYGPVDLKSSAYVTCFNEDQSLRRSEWRLVVDADGQASSANPSIPGPIFPRGELHWHTHRIGCISQRQTGLLVPCFWAGGENLGAGSHTPMQGLRTVKFTCRNHAALECQNA